MRPRSTRRRGPRRPRAQFLRLLLPLAFIAVAAFLYARPISNYLDTRRDLDARERAVTELRAEKRALQRQLDRTTSLDALARQARRIGYVKPGEQLFIVKGIPAWRRAHAQP